MYYCDFQVDTPWELETFGTFEGSTPKEARDNAIKWVKNCYYDYKVGNWKWKDFRFPIYKWSEDGLRRISVVLLDDV